MCVHCMCVHVHVSVYVHVSVHVCISNEREIVLLVPATTALGRGGFCNVFCQCQTKRAYGCWCQLHNSMACCYIWDALSD